MWPRNVQYDFENKICGIFMHIKTKKTKFLANKTYVLIKNGKNISFLRKNMLYRENHNFLIEKLLLI